VFRQTVVCNHALVVDAHKRDHVFDVRLGLDPARAEAGLAGKDRVVADPVRLEERLPHCLREAEVGRAIAVQVADLATADLERELATPTRARCDACPRDDLLGVRSLGLCRSPMIASFNNPRSSAQTTRGGQARRGGGAIRCQNVSGSSSAYRPLFPPTRRLVFASLLALVRALIGHG
jgi:hypothetical protein